MDNHYLIAEFKNRRDFETAIEVLEKAHFDPEEVSAVVQSDDESLAELSAAKGKTPASPLGEKTTATILLKGNDGD